MKQVLPGLLLLLISLQTLHVTLVTGEEDDSDLEIIDEFIKNHKFTAINSTSGDDPKIEKKGNSSAPLHSSPQAQADSPINPHIDSRLQGKVPQLPIAPFQSQQVSGKDQDVINEENPCSCVKYFLCDIDNGTVIDNGDVVGLIDIRLGSSKISPCSHYFDICCKTMKKESDTAKITKPSAEHSVCGKRNTGGVGFRITGGVNGESQFGEFPWMAAIVRQEPQGEEKPPLNIFVCGGSLIHPKVVLTAAHCVFGKPPNELKVRLGEWDTQTQDELYHHQDRLVSKIIVHEDYYMGALYNDIALIFLDEEIKFAPNVDTICLPPPNIHFDGQRCVASGWGKDSFEKEGKYQVILKKLDLPVVPKDNCEAALRKTRLGPYFKLDSSFVCAGGEPGKDTCRGDGGSPLVCQLPNSNYYVQFGVVAWGIGCGERGIPGVYVNVPKFVPWIEEKMIQAKLDTKYYKSS